MPPQQDKQRSQSVHNIADQNSHSLSLARPKSQSQIELRSVGKRNEQEPQEREQQSADAADVDAADADADAVMPRLIVVESKEEDKVLERPGFNIRAKSDGFLYDSDSSSISSPITKSGPKLDWRSSEQQDSDSANTFYWKSNVVYFNMHTNKCERKDLKQFIKQMVRSRHLVLYYVIK